MLITCLAFAQAPQAISYQAVLRNASGVAQANSTADLRFSILQGSVTGSSVYVETHSVTTDTYGSFNLAIGNGTPTTGVFASINWANGPYFLQTEMDTASNGSYMVLSTSQFLSVPYALYAANGGYCIDTLTNTEITVVRDSVVVEFGETRNYIALDLDYSFYTSLTDIDVIYRTYVNGLVTSHWANTNLWGVGGSGMMTFPGKGIGILPSGSTFTTEVIFDVYPCKKVFIHTTTVP